MSTAFVKKSRFQFSIFSDFNTRYFSFFLRRFNVSLFFNTMIWHLDHFSSFFFIFLHFQIRFIFSVLQYFSQSFFLPFFMFKRCHCVFKEIFVAVTNNSWTRSSSTGQRHWAGSMTSDFFGNSRIAAPSGRGGPERECYCPAGPDASHWRTFPATRDDSAGKSPNGSSAGPACECASDWAPWSPAQRW